MRCRCNTLPAAMGLAFTNLKDESIFSFPIHAKTNPLGKGPEHVVCVLW
jgi:hypothetical protein